MSQFRGNLAYEDFILPPDLQTGHIELEIDHTERTWGDDIMSMLLGYVNSHVTHLGKVRDWMCTNAIKICFALAMMCLITGSWLSFRLSNDIPAELQSLIANRELLPNNIETISQKINWLLVLGTRQSQDFYPAIILVLTIIAFFVCLIYLPRLIRSLPASFVIFSAKTQEHMANQDKTHARRRIIGDSLLLGTVASLIASWIWSLMNLV